MTLTLPHASQEPFASIGSIALTPAESSEDEVKLVFRAQKMDRLVFFFSLPPDTQRPCFNNRAKV